MWIKNMLHMCQYIELKKFESYIQKCHKILLFVFIIGLLAPGCSNKEHFTRQINSVLENKDRGMYTDEQFDAVFRIIENNPQTFEYYSSTEEESPKKFEDEFVMDMNVVESDDKKVLAYILERSGFSGNPAFGYDTSTLLQYCIDGKIYTFRIPEDNSKIEEISSLSDGKYLFITFSGNVHNGEHFYNNARMYKLDSSGVQMVSNAFENNGNRVDEIEVYWEGVEMDENLKEELMECEDCISAIFYNSMDGNLYVGNTDAVPSEYNNHEKYVFLNGTFDRYRWEENIFKNVTLMEPYEVRNEDYYIRIEQEADGNVVYRCWNGGEKIGKPDLVIRNGKRLFWDEMPGLTDYNKWVSLDAYSPIGEKYVFFNNGYEYHYNKGWHKGHMYEELQVYTPDGDLIYSEEFDRINLN